MTGRKLDHHRVLARDPVEERGARLAGDEQDRHVDAIEVDAVSVYPEFVPNQAVREETVGYNIRRVQPPIVQVECVFFGPFREDVGEKTVHFETDAEHVGDLLAEIEREYPVLDGRLLDGDETAGTTVVTVDRKNVVHLDGFETEIDEESVVRLVPSVYGG